jgi:hypothetical protein
MMIPTMVRAAMMVMVMPVPTPIPIFLTLELGWGLDGAVDVGIIWFGAVGASELVRGLDGAVDVGVIWFGDVGDVLERVDIVLCLTVSTDIGVGYVEASIHRQ